MVRKNQLRPSLNVTLSQRLAMTPSLLQKIELLTLNQLELSDLMTQEMVENPFLEESQDGAEEEATGQSESQEDERQTEEEREREIELEQFDFEYFLGEDSYPSYRNAEFNHNDSKPSFEIFLASGSSLTDHLNWQLNLMEMSDPVRRAADYIVGNLDEDGYLQMQDEEICEALRTDNGAVAEAIAIVQSLDPLGVGARSVQECLLIQLRAGGLEQSLAARIVSECHSLLERRKFDLIARELGCTMQEIIEAMELLRRLSPQPGQKYNQKEPIYIRPDVFLYKIDDRYQIMLNDDGLPRLRLNRAYRRALLKGSGVSRDTKSYVKERFRSAVELLRSIDQRQQTIYRVCKAIIRRQGEFLEKGKLYLKPMLIKDVAEELEVHPSTISRVVANKYAHTPQGVIELRRFFTIGVEGAGGESVSSVHVKEKIRQILDAEDPKKPFSDQKISSILSQGGIQITRRTVAKYRDQMNIPGSRDRKSPMPY
jgi:RNA polymerase sigma-54 factor